MKTKNLVSRLFLMFVLVALTLVTGTSALAQEPVKITVWMHNHQPRVPLDEANIARFEAENPDVDVELVIIENAEFDTRLNTGLASGQGPDVFNQWTAYIGQFYQSGLLAPVDPKPLGFDSIDEVYALYGEAGEKLLAGATFDGVLYGIPTELSIYGCYANNDLFREAGLDPEKDFPKTWEQMREVAEKLTVRDSGGSPTRRGYDFPWTSPVFMYLVFEPMVAQLGLRIVDDLELTVNLNNEQVMQVMQYWYDWVNTWKLGGPQYTDSRTAFWNGELAIDCLQGNWGVPLIEEAGIDWSLHPAPRWENAVNDNGMALYAYFLMVNAFSSPEKQEAGWRLIRYLTDTPEEALTQAGLFQPRVDLLQSETFLNDPVMPLFLEEMSKSFYTPLVPGWNESAAALARARDRIVLNNEDMATVLAEAQQEMMDIIARAAGR